MAAHRPCKNCPWRRDATPEYWDPQHHRQIARNCRGDGISIMLCHNSKLPERKIICAGWAAVEGFNAIGLRIAAIQGTYDPDKLNVRGLDLYASFDEMLAANFINDAPTGRVDPAALLRAVRRRASERTQ